MTNMVNCAIPNLFGIALFWKRHHTLQQLTCNKKPMNVKPMEAMWSAVPLFTLLEDVQLSEVSLRMSWKAFSCFKLYCWIPYALSSNFKEIWAAVLSRVFSLGYKGSLEMWRMFLLTMRVPWRCEPILTKNYQKPWSFCARNTFRFPYVHMDIILVR